ncbi:MAG: hypothetical protein GEV07_00160 [Streptosporangiales bacterium]|nr:hypothetical protein [Streptosporangiales bacterium]
MTRTVQVFSPLGRQADIGDDVKTEVANLAGGVLGILDNTKPNARFLMEQVAQRVGERAGGMQLSIERKGSAAEGMNEDVRERLAATANVIFTGSGD